MILREIQREETIQLNRESLLKTCRTGRHRTRIGCRSGRCQSYPTRRSGMDRMTAPKHRKVAIFSLFLEFEGRIDLDQCAPVFLREWSETPLSY